MRLKQLRGLPVIDPTAARKIGSVVDYQVDPASGRLAALDVERCRRRWRGRARPGRAHPPRRAQRRHPDRPRRRRWPGLTPEVDERWLDSSSLVGLEVMGDDGDRVGEVLDATFDQDTLKIEAYVLRSDVLQRLTGRARSHPARTRAVVQPRADAGRAREGNRSRRGGAGARRDDDRQSARSRSKVDDRLPAPSFDQVPDGKAISVH